MSEYNHDDFLRPQPNAISDRVLGYIQQLTINYPPQNIHIYKSSHDQYLSICENIENDPNPEITSYTLDHTDVAISQCTVRDIQYHLSDDFRIMTKIINIERSPSNKRIALEFGKRATWLELDSSGYVTEYMLERIN